MWSRQPSWGSAELGLILLLLGASAGLGACSAPSATAGLSSVAGQSRPEIAEVGRLLFDLAADSMEGRATATRGEERAARYLAAHLSALGIEPAGDSAYVQRVPLRVVERPGGRRALDVLPSWEAYEALPTQERSVARNVIGIIRGSAGAHAGEAILVGAHYDHLGIGPAVQGDSIYNGADDDASGVVAVLEIARALASSAAPERSVIFFLATGEEVGMLGTRWYLANPVVPLDSITAGLFFEMIGRPDPLVGGSGRAWLTGFGRSTMGMNFRDAELPILPDPRPEQNFFERSDNTPFARLGIPAHVISSYNMHDDYHTPRDEGERIDLQHMVGVIEAGIEATRLLASGPAPEWYPGGRP